MAGATGSRTRREPIEMRGGHNDGFLVSGEECVAGLETFLAGVLR
jgi:hypothetical protein